MIKLNPPLHVNIDLFDNIVRKKQMERKNRLLRIREHVNNRYNEYSNNCIELSVLQQLDIFTEAEIKDLISCYGENIEFSRIEKEIKELQEIAMQSVCPYCGIGEPNTIDHYIPKSLYPEFSVFGLNLIPCCWTCNMEKGEKWLENGNRRIINFYFDSIPNEKFLHAIVSFNEHTDVPTLSLELRSNPKINQQFFRTIETHFRDLKLIERFEKKLNDEISNIYLTIVSSLTLTIEEQKRNLETSSSVLKSRYGINFWKAALIDALCECDEFFEKCYRIA